MSDTLFTVEVSITDFIIRVISGISVILAFALFYYDLHKKRSRK